MGAFKNKYNPLLSEDIQITPKTNGLGNQFLADDGNFKPLSYSYKGAISVNTEFPLKASVQIGDWYNVTASVTDNAGATYTNTGLTFTNGDDIFWNGSTWLPYGNAATALVEEFECTVGAIGGQYATLKAAIDAGKTRILVISSTTETSNITTTATTYFIKGTKLSNTITLNANIIFTGLATFVEYNKLTSVANYTSNISGNEFLTGLTKKIESCIITYTKNSGIAATPSSTKCSAYNSTFNLPNAIGLTGNLVTVTAYNCTINGGGTSSRLNIQKPFINCNFTGVFEVIYLANMLINCTSTISASISAGDTTRVLTNLIDGCYLPNFSVGGAVKITNSVILDGYFRVPYENNSIFSDIDFTSTTTMTIASSNCTFINCIFPCSLVITGDFNKFQNCIIGSSGAKTITINAGADYNTIIGCTTGLDIVDNGTGTEMWANTKFL